MQLTPTERPTLALRVLRRLPWRLQRLAARCWVQSMLDASKPPRQQMGQEVGKHPMEAVRAVPLLDREQCEAAVAEAEAYASTATGGWQTDRHLSYATTDIPIRKLPQLERVWNTTVFPAVEAEARERFGLGEGGRVVPLDVFVVKYSATEGEQSELAVHRDNGILTFSLLLNEPADFTGGGTYFERLGRVYRPSRGVGVLHSALVRHGGYPIDTGVRYVMVGFCGLQSQYLVRDFPSWRFGANPAWFVSSRVVSDFQILRRVWPGHPLSSVHEETHAAFAEVDWRREGEAFGGAGVMTAGDDSEGDASKVGDVETTRGATRSDTPVDAPADAPADAPDPFAIGDEVLVVNGPHLGEVGTVESVAHGLGVTVGFEDGESANFKFSSVLSVAGEDQDQDQDEDEDEDENESAGGAVAANAESDTPFDPPPWYQDAVACGEKPWYRGQHEAAVQARSKGTLLIATPDAKGNLMFELWQSKSDHVALFVAPAVLNRKEEVVASLVFRQGPVQAELGRLLSTRFPGAQGRGMLRRVLRLSPRISLMGVVHVYALRDWRGDGCGAALMLNAMEALRGLGVTHILTLADDDGSGKLREWYEGLGFVDATVFMDTAMVAETRATADHATDEA